MFGNASNPWMVRHFTLYLSFPTLNAPPLAIHKLQLKIVEPNCSSIIRSSGGCGNCFGNISQTPRKYIKDNSQLWSDCIRLPALILNSYQKATWLSTSVFFLRFCCVFHLSLSIVFIVADSYNDEKVKRKKKLRIWSYLNMSFRFVIFVAWIAMIANSVSAKSMYKCR